ncbi:helix-turn-helix domain-containing protein [Merismopedia glauca]|uniref:Transposase n=1 Tax=Merismopedia glauca CCAP 1448/3 TaxID=1296344 RepID=A0A2T1C4A9_9CYAN|nr:helix-turn-helix domain-containing protein [Merismopedia glauca]PSB03122.1 transposase [Merismopedia glauca CCAP 1448/3]
MKPYSIDIRQKILETKLETQESDEEIAMRFRVSRSFVNKLVRKYKQTGSLEPLPHRGGASRKLTPEEIEIVIQLVKNDCDATLKQLRDRLNQKKGTKVSISTISRLLKRLMLRYNQK